MNASRTERAQKIFGEHREWYGRVPHETGQHVCPYCLGPVTPTYTECNGCARLFKFGDAPAELRGRVVPMTTVLNPSPWYSALLTYKTTQWAEYAPIVAALAFLWISAHESHIEELLGGAADFITIVPSKKGTSYENQKLRRLLVPFGDRVVQTLRCANATNYQRQGYDPRIFEPAGEDVRYRRLIVVEDTWTTGSTAVSACGALLDAGAESVVLTPIARMFNGVWVGAEHPYRAHLNGSYDLQFWPR